MILRKGIELHGFDSPTKFAEKLITFKPKEILYHGYLKDVTEQQAIDLVNIELIRKRHGTELFYYDYVLGIFHLKDALDSLKSATDKEWIIITSHE